MRGLFAIVMVPFSFSIGNVALSTKSCAEIIVEQVPAPEAFGPKTPTSGKPSKIDVIIDIPLDKLATVINQFRIKFKVDKGSANGVLKLDKMSISTSDQSQYPIQ